MRELCEHGAKRERHKDITEDIAFACPLGTCGCCGTIFPYMDEYSCALGETEAEDKEWRRSWTPVDRCELCGGKYVETGENPWKQVTP